MKGLNYHTHGLQQVTIISDPEEGTITCLGCFRILSSTRLAHVHLVIGKIIAMEKLLSFHRNACQNNIHDNAIAFSMRHHWLLRKFQEGEGSSPETIENKLNTDLLGPTVTLTPIMAFLIVN